jgi:nucleoside-diphosphate-sugar epimerase
MPGLPQIAFAVVDVRDCADLHLRAMTDPKAAGERFIACSDEQYNWAKDIALKVKNGMGEQGKKVPTRTVPNFVIRFMSFFDGEVATITPELGSKFIDSYTFLIFEWHADHFMHDT